MQKSVNAIITIVHDTALNKVLNLQIFGTVSSFYSVIPLELVSVQNCVSVTINIMKQKLRSNWRNGVFFR